MRKLGETQDNKMSDGGNTNLDVKDKIITDKNDQTKEEQAENKKIKQGTASSEVNVLATDRPVSGTVTSATQVSTVPIEAITVKEHETLIKAVKTGNYNFLVQCECQWQGRFVTIREANEGAAAHKRARLNLMNVNK